MVGRTAAVATLDDAGELVGCMCEESILSDCDGGARGEGGRLFGCRSAGKALLVGVAAASSLKGLSIVGSMGLCASR